MVGLWVTVSLAVFSGLTMYSIYKNCDPLGNGDVITSDQVRDAVAPVLLFIYLFFLLCNINVFVCKATLSVC